MVEFEAPGNHLVPIIKTMFILLTKKTWEKSRKKIKSNYLLFEQIGTFN